MSEAQFAPQGDASLHPRREQLPYDVLPPYEYPHHKRSLPFRIAVTALSFTLLLVGCTGGYAAYQYGHFNGQIKREDALQRDDTNVRQPEVQREAENYLLLGSDTREGLDASFGDVEGARSDTTILIHLAADRKKVTVVSFPRDSWVQIPACKATDGSTIEAHEGMFNSAFTDGGSKCTVLTVQKLTGIAITHYVQVDFVGFTSMVNALDGVVICSPEQVYDPYSGLNLKVGDNKLKGDQALAYVRARYALGDGSDIGRIKRQQLFFGAVLRQAMSGKLLSNPAKLNRFLDKATKSITLDRGTSIGDLRTLATSMRGLDPARVSFYTAPIANQDYSPPGTDLTGKVLLDDAAGRLLYDSIINDRAIQTPKATPTPKPSSPGATSSPATPSATPTPTVTPSSPSATPSSPTATPSAPSSTPASSSPAPATSVPSSTPAPSPTSAPSVPTVVPTGINGADTTCSI